MKSHDEFLNHLFHLETPAKTRRDDKVRYTIQKACLW